MKLRNLMSVGFTVEDLEDWERLLVPAEAAAARRAEEIRANLPHHRSIAATLGVPSDKWTALDLDKAYALHEAHEGGVLRDVVDHPGVEPRWAVGDVATARLLGSHTKRDLVTIAKKEAAALGLRAPKSYADVIADVVLFAATWAACQRDPKHTNNQGASE